MNLKLLLDLKKKNYNINNKSDLLNMSKKITPNSFLNEFQDLQEEFTGIQKRALEIKKKMIKMHDKIKISALQKKIKNQI